jgi:UDP-N-acetylmuramate: L-alanyl-gamma-D-glutamyl-meso-diaminopimelate ligase
MATLAALLQRAGHRVQGSDENVYPPMSDFLKAESIRTFTGYAAEHITDDIDLVVVGNAISRGNAELETVLDRRQRYCSLPEAIRDFFLWGASPVVLAGTHGKTTTTSLTGWLLTHAHLDPTVLVGGVALNFGGSGSSYRVGQGRHFVIEGDEYDSAYFDKTAKFLKYLPHVAVVNNVEFDHADIYADLDAVLLAFRRFVRLVPRSGLVLLGSDSPHALSLRDAVVGPVETFGLAAGSDWQAENVTHRNGVTAFELRRRGEPFGRFESPLLGLHNVRNALAGIAVGAHAGVPAATLAAGLQAFRGIRRRLERVGEARGVLVLDDFAHHPTAVQETLAAVRTGYPGRRIWAVFEPRSASSCRRVFQDDFASAFALADEVVVAPVFRSSLPESERLSVPRLVDDVRARGRAARTLGGVDEIVAALAGEVHEGDLVVAMSIGGFGGIHKKLLAAIGASAVRSPEPGARGRV